MEPFIGKSVWESSFSSLDNWTQDMHFFEKIVLRKARTAHSLSDQEQIDMIGMNN